MFKFDFGQDIGIDLGTATVIAREFDTFEIKKSR